VSQARQLRLTIIIIIFVISSPTYRNPPLLAAATSREFPLDYMAARGWISSS